MNTFAPFLAALLLTGCAAIDDVARFGKAVQQAGDSAGAPGAATGSGSVASGGTGYLPCPSVDQRQPPARRECD